MRAGKALFFGVLGAAAISLITGLVRALGVPVGMEMLLGTLVRHSADSGAFGLGLLLHLAMGGIFGLVYGYLFERVWNHGGATTGMLVAVVHASFIGILIGLTPQFHPLVPRLLPDPGPYFSGLGLIGIVTFFVAHAAYGAVVGAGYGHVAAERQWAPTGRL